MIFCHLFLGTNQNWKLLYLNNVSNRNRCRHLKVCFKTSSKSRNIKLLVNLRYYTPHLHVNRKFKTRAKIPARLIYVSNLQSLLDKDDLIGLCSPRRHNSHEWISGLQLQRWLYGSNLPLSFLPSYLPSTATNYRSIFSILDYLINEILKYH